MRYFFSATKLSVFAPCRVVLGALLWASLVQPSLSQLATIDLTAYPEAAPADAKSSVSISASIRDQSGRYVPDGTLVSFITSLGQFREAVVATSGGVARAILVAPNVPGRARVTASVVSYRAVADVEVAFVEDGTELRKTAFYLEATGSDYLAYHLELRIIAATGAKKSASVLYRDVQVHADDLQLELDTLGLIAYNAVLKTAGTSLDTLQLAYNLTSRSGTAVVEREGKLEFVRIDGAEITPATRPAGYDEFRFTELAGPQTIVVARRIIVKPGKEILFNSARVYVGTNRVLTLPHYVVDLTRHGALITEQMFGVNQNGLLLDLPYYISMGPRQSNSFRLRTQHTSGRGYTTSRGTTLDWVSRYSDGTNYTGDFTITDISPNRWGATLRHSQRFTGRTDAYFLLDAPRHDSLSLFVQLSHQSNGFSTSVSAAGRSALGSRHGTERRLDLAVETNPTSFLDRALYHTVGITASYQHTEPSMRTSRQGYGLRYRVRTVPVRFGRGVMSAGMVVTRLWGRGDADGLWLSSALSTAHQLNSSTTFSLNYEYSDSPVGVTTVGRHRLAGQLVSQVGSLSTTFYGTRSLERDVATAFLDASLQLSRAWRLGLGYTWDSGVGMTFRDYYFSLGYRLGYRELVLRWSSLDNRLGIELLAVPY